MKAAESFREFWTALERFSRRPCPFVPAPSPTERAERALKALRTHQSFHPNADVQELIDATGDLLERMKLLERNQDYRPWEAP